MYAICVNLNNGVIFSDIIGEMNVYGNEKMYFGIDYYWNVCGVYYGYVVFCKSVGLILVLFINMEKKVKYGFLGSMY